MEQITTEEFLKGALAHDKMYNRLYRWNDERGQVDLKKGVSGNWEPIKFTLNHFLKHMLPKYEKYEVQKEANCRTIYVIDCGENENYFEKYSDAVRFILELTIEERIKNE